MSKVMVSTENLAYADWLKYRRRGIGGSDAAAVCGISRYKSPFELWLDKTGQLTEQEAGEPAYWGTQLEPVVRNEFQKRSGIEVKSLKHMLQIQHYMAVTGFKGTYIAVLIGGNSFKWKFVERDEELISMLIKLEADFWEHVKNGTPPPIDGSEATAKFLADKFAECNSGTSVELPDSASELIAQYEKTTEQIEALNGQKRLAENKLKEMLGSSECGTIGRNTVLWKPVTQERLDSKSLKSEQPDIYKKYASKTTYRRFTIKTANIREN